ncbi:MAG: NAD(P)/FAD-dependent oxidoreductase [Myxococcota bacterium]
MRIVIIGNGVAGMEAALTVREREPTWDITLISEESDHFFSRTALMWVATGQLSHACIEPLERDVYERMNFTRVRARAVGIDIAARTVTLAGGLDPVPYDRLLIACGSRPRPGPWPGSDLPGVGAFVTHQDLGWLEEELHGGPGEGGPAPRTELHMEATTDDSPYRIRPTTRAARGGAPKHPAVVGGGLIGIEAVEVMAAAGIHPRFLIREEWFWPLAIDKTESTWIANRMQEHGVLVQLQENLEEIRGADRIESLKTDKGEYDCDLLVIAIGVIPNTDWLKDSGVALDNRGGLIVDDQLRVLPADPEGTYRDNAAAKDLGIFAAGDCASVRWFDGSQRPEQLWYTARDQGRIAGRGLLGDTAQRYARGHWYNSAKLFDIEYTTVGLVNMNVQGEENWFFEERSAVRSTSRIVVAEGRVVGFNFLGRRWDHTVLLRWIEEHRSLPWVLAHLQEANFDTEFVPPLVIPQSAQTQSLRGPAYSLVRQPLTPPAV